MWLYGPTSCDIDGKLSQYQLQCLRSVSLDKGPYDHISAFNEVHNCNYQQKNMIIYVKAKKVVVVQQIHYEVEEEMMVVVVVCVLEVVTVVVV